MARIMARKTVEQVLTGAQRCLGGLHGGGEDLAEGAAELWLRITGRFPLEKLAGAWQDMLLVGEDLKELD